MSETCCRSALLLEDDGQVERAHIAVGAFGSGQAKPPAGAVIIDPSDGGIRAFAWATLGVDLNPDAALFKRGRELKLGYPRSQELRAVDIAGTTHVVQLFAGGILTAEDGRWGNIRFVAWA